MRIQSLHVKNFKSIGDIRVEFPSKGIIVIDGKNEDVGGSNGAAKTSLVSSIPFCFFGKPLGGGTIADYIRFGESDFFIKVDFIHSGNNITTIRTKDNFSLIINNKEFSGTKKALTQEFVRLTGLTFQSFKALFLGQTWESFIDMTPARRVEALETIFSVNIFDEALKLLKNKKSKLETKKHNLEKEISHIQGIIISNKESLQPKIDEFEFRRQEGLARLRKEFEDTKVLKKTIFDKIEAEKVGLDVDPTKELDNIRRKVEQLQEDLQQLDRELSQLESSYKSYETELKYLIIERNKLSKQIVDLQNNICPLCGQKINDNSLLAVRRTDLKKIDEKVQEITVIRKEIKEKHTSLLVKRDDKARSLKRFKGLYEKCLTIISRIREFETTLQQLDNKLQRIRDEYNRLKQEENPYVQLEEERKKRLRSAERQLGLRRKKLSDVERQIDYCDIWAKVFKAARAEAFSDMLNLLELKANQFLKYLYPEFTIKFDYKNGKLDIVVLKQNREVSFRLLSGGEQQITRLAALLGLFDVIKVRIAGSIDFIVLDEPLQHLDIDKREKFFSLLKVLASNMQVFIIDHHADFGQDIDMLITVVKKNGVSYLGDVQ